VDIREKWPWWAELHAFWRELPNYNTILGANSTPHHCAADALAAFGPGVGEDAASGQNVELEHDKDGIDDLRGDSDNEVRQLFQIERMV
jgi:hypothetical protein